MEEPVEAGCESGEILVVDDDEDVREYLKLTLAAAGYSVTAVSGGAEAVEAFPTSPFRAVLLDVMMHGMDGFDTLRQLRGLERGPDVPVVIMTALGDRGTKERAAAAGADDFLTKPIEELELVVRVRAVTAMGRLRAELRQAQAVIRSQIDAITRVQRQRRELASLLVHDLKGPLSAMLLNLDPLAASGSLSDRDRLRVEELKTSAEDMQRMVVDLLDVELSEHGALVPKLASVDLVALAGEVLAQMRVRAVSAGVDLVEATSGQHVLRGDRDLLRRLLANLLDNAITHGPQGTPVKFEIVPGPEGRVEIRVSDEGPGVPEEARERIFDRFARSADSTGRVSHGLGLSFCRLAARVHGGRIWVEDNTPTGARFCVTLPAA